VLHLHPEWAVEASVLPAWVEAVCLCPAWVEDKPNQVDSLLVVKNITAARRGLEAAVTCLCPAAMVEQDKVEAAFRTVVEQDKVVGTSEVVEPDKVVEASDKVEAASEVEERDKVVEASEVEAGAT